MGVGYVDKSLIKNGMRLAARSVFLFSAANRKISRPPSEGMAQADFRTQEKAQPRRVDCSRSRVVSNANESAAQAGGSAGRIDRHQAQLHERELRHWRALNLA
jgi:hypothetical protein